MKGLYKGRYLIAVYDRNDYLVDVGLSVKELHCVKRITHQMFSKTTHGGYQSRKYYLIDCLEKHDDIFAEEDEIFLQEINRIPTCAEEAKRLGVNIRTYFRHKAKGTLYKLENKNKD